jgi:hypothetical protein
VEVQYRQVLLNFLFVDILYVFSSLTWVHSRSGFLICPAGQIIDHFVSPFFLSVLGVVGMCFPMIFFSNLQAYVRQLMKDNVCSLRVPSTFRSLCHCLWSASMLMMNIGTDAAVIATYLLSSCV